MLRKFPPPVSFVIVRLLQAVPVLSVIVVCSFLLLKMAPGDMVDALVGDMGGADPKYVSQLRLEYGLDQPTFVQLLLYLKKMAQFDLGYSYFYQQPVLTLLLSRLMPTLVLMGCSLGFAFVVGVGLGAFAASRANTKTDNAISVVGLIFYATPSFFLALLFILAFSVKLGWFPVSGYRTIGAARSGWGSLIDITQHMFLPVAALSLVYLSFYVRLMRANVIEVLELDFVRTARAKGASGHRLMFSHVIRNAMLPVVTLLGLQFSSILGGSVAVETVFSIPGLGQLAYTSVIKRDMNTLMGLIFFCGILVVLVNIVVDLVYSRLDARISL